VVTFADESGVSVTLVAAYHSADRRHFAAIQERLARHALVLYEGWMHDDDETATSGGWQGFLARCALTASNALQALAERWLDVRHVDQWSGAVDFARANFVNADMSWSTFARRCAERGEFVTELAVGWRLLPGFLLGALLRSLPRSCAEAVGLLDLPADLRQALRCLWAREVAAINRLYGACTARRAAVANVTIHERNALVVDNLAARLAAGTRDCAIYYGAAHMPDFERRLVERGFRRAQVEWIEAWAFRRGP
jgi:hypothetical protein